ncbi:MAG: hypothetical protein JWM71_159 [Solirubrobacteraceae bacterium]|nr:hypothetical protein [Solirubrobacteraceae bacterium]
MLTRAAMLTGLLVALGAAPAAARVHPVAAISGPATIQAGTPVTFDAGSSTHDPAGSIVDYAWDLDGSGRFRKDTGADPRLTTTLNVPGTVTVAVRVTDDAGDTSVADGEFLVQGAPPVARFTVPSPVVAGATVTLDASTSSTSAQWTDFAWDLDGAGFTQDTEGTPSLTTSFPQPGTYRVVLRVRDSAQGEDTVTHTIDVVAPGSAPAPAGSLGGDPAAGVAALGSADQKWIRVGSPRHFAALNGAARRRVGAVRAHGLWVNLLSDRAARFDLDVLVPAKVGRRLGLHDHRSGSLMRIARVRTRLPAAGQRPYAIRLPAAVRRALRAPVTLLVRGTASDGHGHRANVRRAFALRR